MAEKEQVHSPELGMEVFHEEICNGNECMKIVGIRIDEVELEGDYSGGTHNVIQKEWFPLNGLFRLRKVCDEVVKNGSCQLHNLHCSYPSCRPYLTSTHHYKDGIKIEH